MSRLHAAPSADALLSPEVLSFLACPWCGAEGITANPTSHHAATLACSACPKTTTFANGIWRAMGPHKRQLSIAQLTNVWPTAIFYESLWRPGALSRFSGRPFPLSEELGEMCAAVRPAPGTAFVDIACSEGLYGRTLAANGALVFTVDHSIPMLKKVARRSAAEHVHSRVIAVQAVAQHLPFVTKSMNGTVIGGSFNEIGNRTEAVEEMHRVTRAGGTSFSMHLLQGRTPLGRFLQSLVKPSGIVSDTADGWRRDLTATGLRVETDHIDRVVQRLTLRAT